MNHRERFDRAIVFIEARLDNPPSLDEVAERVFLTPTYFSRLFRTLSGYSVMGYARNRRLSEAAKRIANEPSCSFIDIAMDSGFASQQAFTRAFQQAFGVSPGQVRTQQSVHSLNLMEPLTMTTTKIHIDHELKDIEPIRTIGLAEEFDMISRLEGIPALWQRFVPYIGTIAGQQTDGTYGVCCDHDNGMTYSAAVAVEPNAHIPEGLTEITIPGGLYAVFTHRGEITAIRDTVAWIWNDWLPNNQEYQSRGTPDFEYYDDRFDPETATGDVDIYVPLAPRMS
ncbi:MAG: AraC family transcriptional regulator [Pseudomonadota bacterium]